jgi:hypothetical protein
MNFLFDKDGVFGAVMKETARIFAVSPIPDRTSTYIYILEISD